MKTRNHRYLRASDYGGDTDSWRSHQELRAFPQQIKKLQSDTKKDGVNANHTAYHQKVECSLRSLDPKYVLVEDRIMLKFQKMLGISFCIFFFFFFQCVQKMEDDYARPHFVGSFKYEFSGDLNQTWYSYQKIEQVSPERLQPCQPVPVRWKFS